MILSFVFLILGFVYISRMGVNVTPRNDAPVAPSEQEQILEHFELEGFDAEGNQSWHLVGESAHVSLNKDVYIERNAILTLNRVTRVYADKVFWQHNKSRFITNQPVRIVHEGVEILGVGAQGRLNEKFVQLNENIRMNMSPGTVITAKGPMRVFQDRNQAILYRDVWILDPRGAVSSDRMDAFFDAESRQINQVIATSNVRISRGEDVTFAQKATYNVLTGSVKLEGAPEIEIADTTEAKEKYGSELEL